MSQSSEICLAALTEQQTEAILLQLDKRELRILAQTHLKAHPNDSRTCALLLSRCHEFTLLTKIVLFYDRY